MHPANLKLVRDLSRMKGQTIAVALVMACGLAVMIMVRSLIVPLESARDVYYSSSGFADIFCDLKRAPNSFRSRLAEIPGVAAVDTRVTGSLTISFALLTRVDTNERQVPMWFTRMIPSHLFKYGRGSTLNLLRSSEF